MTREEAGRLNAAISAFAYACIEAGHAGTLRAHNAAQRGRKARRKREANDRVVETRRLLNAEISAVYDCIRLREGTRGYYRGRNS